MTDLTDTTFSDLLVEVDYGDQGGQHVGRVHFNVTVTHLPSGIVATVPSSLARSQHRARAIAVDMIEGALTGGHFNG